MKLLDAKLIKTVESAMKGARLAKFQKSIANLQQSLAEGNWVQGLGGGRSASSGFYQGLYKVESYSQDYNDKKKRKAEEAAWKLNFCLSYGHAMDLSNVEIGLKTLRAKDCFTRYGRMEKITDAQIIAWAKLCLEVNYAIHELDEARPKPVLTAIKLSPKVTKTLKEMNLDIDLPSIKFAKFVWKERQAIDRKTGELRFDKDGEPVMERYEVIVWTKGIKHGQSRFAGGGCEACGKTIPSGRFVPIEAHDKNNGGRLISLWLGCDCARNIFGVKDIGVERPK